MKMDLLSRRDFAKKSVAYAAVGANAAFAQSREIPVLRIGILSDLHYRTFDNGKGLQNCLGIESTLRYLDRRKVDGVVACGDITDFGTAEALRQLGKLWFKVFPDNRRSDGEKIKPLFLMGDHDMGGYMHTEHRKWVLPACPDPKELEEIIPEMDVAKLWKECFREDWSPLEVKTLKGVQFVMAHHPLHTKASDNGNSIPGLAEFMARQNFDPSKPFFYVQHRVLRNTLGFDSQRGWESGKATKVLEKYPNAIALCGHAHRNVTDEYSLWQGAFTAIQVPSANYCTTRYDHENGYQRKGKVDIVSPPGNIRRSWQGLVGTLYSDRFVVERIDLLNEEKLAPDWAIPLPSPDGSQAVAVRAKKAAAPQFASDAKVSVNAQKMRTNAKKVEEVAMVSFPVAHATERAPRAFDYRVDAVAGGKTIASKLVFSKGQFWIDEKDTLPVECPFRISDLPADWKTSVKFVVTPRDSFGNEGRSI